ncbi:MAG: VacJ family lipoprotein [Burkholderiales bacterium]|nr:VacJ family lipoprotein [Burkholderiales bacterium]
MTLQNAGAQCVRLTILLSLFLLQACATVANPDPRDPLESFNRGVFGFNDAVDRAVVKPVATAYRDITPQWFRVGVGNFFGNLTDVWSVFNNALQGRGQDMGDSLGRVMINTTFGLGGLVDVASDLNIERRTSDFGLTLGRWGVSPGPYVVLPLLGPYTLREVVALPLDQQGNLVNHISDEGTRTGLTVINVVDLRAQYLRAGDVVEGAALDKYSFMRDSYLQRQRNRVYDGNPPDENIDPGAEAR